MQIRVRGWGRDCGWSKVMSEIPLTDIDVKKDSIKECRPGLDAALWSVDHEDGDTTWHYVPRVGSILLTSNNKEGDVDYIFFATKEWIRLNGEYLLEIRFSSSDVIYMAWATLRRKSRAAFARAIGQFKQEAA